MEPRPWVERRVTPRGPGIEPDRTLLVWMPYRGRSNKPWLQRQLPRVLITAGEDSGVWQIRTKYLWKLLKALSTKYAEVDVRLQFSEVSRCNNACQTANPYTVYDCVCSCNGTNHGGVDRWKIWTPSGKHTLISYDNDIREVRFVLRPDDLPDAIIEPAEQQEVTEPEPDPRPAAAPSPVPMPSAPVPDLAHSNVPPAAPASPAYTEHRPLEPKKAAALPVSVGAVPLVVFVFLAFVFSPWFLIGVVVFGVITLAALAT